MFHRKTVADVIKSFTKVVDDLTHIESQAERDAEYHSGVAAEAHEERGKAHKLIESFNKLVGE